MKTKPFLLLVSLALAAAAPAEERVGGPMLGFVLDGRAAVHPILGLPGAARLGRGRALPEGLRLATLAPMQPLATAVASDGSLVQLDLALEAPQPTPISGAAPGADRIFASANGKAALAYHRRHGRAELLRQVSGAFEPAGMIDLASLPGVLTAMAVNDEGSLALVAVASRQGGGALYAVEPGAPPRLVLPVERALAIQFLNEQDALAADADRLEVLLIRDVLGAASVERLVSAADGLTTPTAVAVSPDGAFAYAAAPEASAVFVAPLAGGAPRRIDCQCAPRVLERLDGAAFRLTDNPFETVYLLDAAVSAGEPRVLFAPPAAAPEAP